MLLELEEIEAELARLQDELEKDPVERRKPRPRVHQRRAEHFEKLPVHKTIVIEPEEMKADRELYERIGE